MSEEGSWLCNVGVENVLLWLRVLGSRTRHSVGPRGPLDCCSLSLHTSPEHSPLMTVWPFIRSFPHQHVEMSHFLSSLAGVSVLLWAGGAFFFFPLLSKVLKTCFCVS